MTATEPCRILLALPTLDRPEGLARLLDAVAALALPPATALDVLVLDNSADAGAAATVAQRHPGFPHPLFYANIPRRGLSQVRNAALHAGLGAKADYLGFIDDDEAPEPGWLDAHLKTLRATGAAASLGAVHAAYEARPPAWVRRGRFLEIRDFADRAALPFGATSNILFALAPVRAHGLRFDPAFDRTGGEDTVFFDAYMRTGAQIVFAAGAVVREAVPPRRASLRWLWRRWRRTGQTNGQIRLSRRDGAGPRLVCAAGGLARVAAGLSLGLATAPLAPLGWPALWARGARITARGAGFIDAAAGRRTLEYAVPER